MLNEKEIWEKVKLFQGMTLYTYTELEPNYIISVEDTSSNNDFILIKDRETRPIREDILAAYKLLFALGELERERDLAWLAEPNKKTSSIIFRIVGELAKEEINVINKKRVQLKLKAT
ncbi:MAG: hypothetical protein ACM34O_07170 [Ignavibacteria bacterium]